MAARLALGALLAASCALRVWLGAVDLDASRFWDERYALENVRVWLTSGSLRPANAFHPALGHLPQSLVLGAVDAVHRATELEALEILEGGDFTSLAYLLSRLLQALWGTLGIYLTYRVGRRMAEGLSDPATGRWVGLLAALLVAGSPWHILQSAIAKPDALLFLLVLLAVELALVAVARPGLRAYLIVGAAAGLAAASKYSGVIAGAPLAVAAFAAARRHPRRVAWLVVAGATAAAMFLALDVYLLLDPELVQRNFGRTLRDYANKGEAAAATRLDVVLNALASLISPPFLGPVFGSLGLLGLVALPVAADRIGRRRGERRRRWHEALVFLAFPVTYVAAYVLVTNNPSEHNWLPLNAVRGDRRGRVVGRRLEVGRAALVCGATTGRGRGDRRCARPRGRCTGVRVRLPRRHPEHGGSCDGDTRRPSPPT